MYYNQDSVPAKHENKQSLKQAEEANTAEGASATQCKAWGNHGVVKCKKRRGGGLKKKSENHWDA